MAHDDGALLASWLRLAGVGDAEARDLALAPLETMAFERFDATTAGARMQADPPAWLERMLASLPGCRHHIASRHERTNVLWLSYT